MAAESPASTATARESERAFLTPPSTTQTSRNSPAPANAAPPARYRQATRLPFELAHHCSLFELSATLAVYPAVTTRASSADLIHASNAAVRYLRDVNRVIGPVNAGFAKAFVFTGSGSSRSRAWRKRGAFGSPTGGDGNRVEDERPIRSAVANKNSLWAKADNFWHVLGWAFNCSVNHKERWERWKIWLELMLEIMEVDWTERNRLCEEQLGRDGATNEELLQQSIIVQYLVNANAGSLSARRMMLRAILADGGPKAISEFKEVFKDELMGKKEEDTKPIKEVKLEEGDFGDLEEPEEDDMDDTDTGKSSGLPFRKPGRNTNTRRASIISLSSDSSSGSEDDGLSPVERLGGIFADNAKLSMLLQQVLRITLPELKWSKHWVEKVLKGVRARQKKARGLHKTSGGGLRSAEIVAEKIFRESEQLMLLLVQMVEDDANVPLDQRPQRADLVTEVEPAGTRDSTSDLSSVPSESDDDMSDLEVLEDVEMKG
ncbi:hypothetical protein SLS58_006329 [Diplodia intermedia]|uniref:Uncharacterized protein n=1 Tax=Diplodia intermedia TaxID=856260 RepID=A0ABR3TN74_9PEZI